MNMLQASNVKDTAVELNFIFEDSYEFEIERNLERLYRRYFFVCKSIHGMYVYDVHRIFGFAF